MKHVFWAILISFSAFGYERIPGTIPLDYGAPVATDLICNSNDCGEGIKEGDLLTPDQAMDYYDRRQLETKGQWTLAELPVQESSLWKNRIGGDIGGPDNLLPLKDMDKVEFLSKGSARLGVIRISVQDKKNDQYTLMFGKTVHNMLLRKALLRKLGYYVPATKHVGRIKIAYGNTKDLISLIKDLKIVNAGAWNRWILSMKASPRTLDEKIQLIKTADFEIPKKLDLDKTLDKYSARDIKKIDEVLTKNLIGQRSNEIVMQDVVAMEEEEYTLNLARGYLEQFVIQGQRKLDSLIIPYALTNVPESINLFDWTVGREYSRNIILKYDIAEEFDCSNSDGIWMVKRLLKLSDKDWTDIVGATKFPMPVQEILKMKLLSRRNHLAKLFKVDATMFPVNSDVSNGVDLVDGKLTKEFYDGYARRFSITDPDSPFAFSDMMAMFKSKIFITTGLEFLVQAINGTGFLGTDISKKIQSYSNEYVTKEITQNTAQALIDGALNATPVKSYKFPTAGGSLILNREIVSGSYMGTDNLIQLVDSIGVSANIGMFGGLFGVDAPIGGKVPFVSASGARSLVTEVLPINVTANARLYYNRIYSHIRPLTSIQKGLKYPFKNMMVPMVMRKYGKTFNSLLNADYQAMTDEKKKAVNKQTYSELAKLTSRLKKAYTKSKKKFKNEELLTILTELSEMVKSNKDDFSSRTKRKKSEEAPLVKKTDAVYAMVHALYEVENCKENKDKVCATFLKGKMVNKKVRIMRNLSEKISLISKAHNYKLLNIQKNQELLDVMNLINENIEIGESVIVTDTVGTSLTIGAGASLFNVAKVNVNVKPDHVMIHRLHILRKNENELHVYKSFGNISGIQFAVSARQFIPIMKITLKKRRGRAKTDFYKVAIGESEIKRGRRVANPNRIEKLTSLRSTFLSGSVKKLKQFVKPVTLRHKFKDTSLKFGVLVARYSKLRLGDEITISTEDGSSTNMYRHYMGNSKGLDYENYMKDLVDVIASKISGLDYSISSFNEGNPGFTFMGKAKNRVLTYETILGEDRAIINPMAKVSNIWNGWQVKKKKALKILQNIKKHYKFSFFEDEVLAQTEKLILYNINVNTFVYEPGLKHILTITEDKIRDIWKKNQTRKMTNFPGDDATKYSGLKKMLKHREKYSKALLMKDYKKMGDHLLKMLEVVDKKLSLKGFQELVGGSENLFAIGRIDGFRIGDENGDNEILSSSFGRIGSEGLNGPFRHVKRALGMTNQEFSLNWLLGRVL